MVKESLIQEQVAGGLKVAQFGGDIALHKMYLHSALNNMKIDVRSSILLIRK